ncbi:MAG: FtsX-like permease family protein [Bacilli bacterium]
MLYKLSISNIKKSFKDYAIYFVTLILGVCIFYLFNSMDSQTAILEVSKRQDEMIDLLIEVLSYVSVFVSCILGFLIIYASRFLIKKRNKEFGIYMLLGMSKRKISFLLLIETFLIGLISLGVGLVLGIFLSQVTSIFVANMFEADMTSFKFNFSESALIKTIVYYGIIYFVVMIFNTIIINKNKLITLLQASKKQEKIKLKNPIICIILFILSIFMLSSAYYMVTDGLEKLMEYDVSIMLVPISLGFIGTILFFYSFAGLGLKIISKCKNIYCKNLNTFIFKQISSKINTTVVSISVICIMLFFTLCLLSSAFTIKNFFNDSINKYAPVDFELIQYFDELNKLSENEMLELIENDTLLKENTKDIFVMNEYYDENFLYKDSLGDYYEEIKTEYPNIMYDAKVEIVKESDYNKISELFNQEKVSLEDNEYVIVSNYEEEIYNMALSKNSVINIFGKSLLPAENKCIEGFIRLGGNPSNIGFFVVSDEVIKNNSSNNIILVGNYLVKDQDKIDYMENKINDFSKIGTSISADTKLKIKEASTGLSAIVTFIGLYLGIIFLISSSAIIALRELSDCLDDRKKYKTLRQIGTDEKDINKALFIQTLIQFFMPLSLAIIHTIFGLKFCTFILSSMGIDGILDGSIMTFIFLIIIYGIYFIITYLYSKNIIKERI